MSALTQPDAVDRYLQLDPETAAVVAAAYGTDPTHLHGATIEATDLDRLDGIISAVTAGRAQAAAMTVAEEAAPELPDLPPVDVTLLRNRIREMDDETRAVFFTAWQASGLPVVLADADGTSVLLPSDEALALEKLIAQHEPDTSTEVRDALIHAIYAMPPGLRYAAEARAAAQGIINLRRDGSGMILTVGRAATLSDIIDTVTAEAADTVGAALGPVVPGQIVTQPVDDAEGLASVPPDGKISDVLAWVGVDVALARIALDQERRRAKPRVGLVSQLAQMVGESTLPPNGSPPSADIDTAAGGDGSVGLASPDVEPHPSPPAAVSYPDGLALADRLVTVADELYKIAGLLTGTDGTR